MTLSINSQYTVIASDGSVVEIPDEFICPISLSPMVHPFITRTGQNFEREAILNWLGQSGTNPLTRELLKPSDLIPNRPLEARIRFWRKNNNIEEPDDKEKTASDFEVFGLLPFNEKTQKELLDRRQNMITLNTLATSGLLSDALPIPSDVTPTESNSRRSRDGRRRFLSRILSSVARELEGDDL